MKPGKGGLFISSTFEAPRALFNLAKLGATLLFQTTWKWYQFSMKTKHMKLEVMQLNIKN